MRLHVVKKGRPRATQILVGSLKPLSPLISNARLSFKEIGQLSGIYLCFLFFSLSYGFAQPPDTSSISLDIPLEEIGDSSSLTRYFLAIKKQEGQLSPEDLIVYYKKGLEAAKRLELKRVVFQFAEELRFLFARLRKDEEALAYSQTMLETARSLRENELMLRAYVSIGTNHMYQEKYLQAIEHYLEALAHRNTYLPDETYWTDLIYYNLSLCYLFSGEVEEAIPYLHLSHTLNDELEGIERDIATAEDYNALMYCYSELGEEDSTEFYIQKVIETLNTIEADTSANSFTISSLKGSLYHAVSQFFLKEDRLEEGKKYYQKLNSSYTLSLDRKYLLDILYALKTQDYAQAKMMIDAPPEIIDTTKNKDYLELLVEYYQAIGDKGRAMRYMEKFHESKYNELKTQRIKLSTYTRNRIEKVQQQNTIERLEKEQMYQGRLKQVFLISLALLLLIVLLLAYLYRQIKAKNNLLNNNAEQAEQLRKVDEQKSRLFANIAHEFQTPLSIIQGIGKHLQEAVGLPATMREPLQIIVRNSTRLSDATTQILEISSADSLSSSIESNWFSLPELIQFVLTEYEFLALEKNISIKQPEYPEAPTPLYSDIHKVTTIVRNLVSNAIRYTDPQGNILLNYRENREEDIYEISIKDTGRGISSKEIPRVFDRYYQSSGEEAEGGFGLGLAISKEYANSINGDIEAQSELGMGSTFTLALPLISSPQAEPLQLHRFPQVSPYQQPTMSLEIEETTELNPHLLIVEDNRDFCAFLHTILSEEYNLKFVHDGYQAIEYLKKYTPNLILMDWMMPGMDGLKLAYYLQSKDAYRHLPLIMLTARNLISDQIKAMRMGLDDYLTKPVETSVLKTRINKLLHFQEEREDFRTLLTVDEEAMSLSSSDVEWLEKIETLIFPLIQNFDLKVEDIAKLSQMSSKNLNRKIKAITGLTAKKFIQEIRYWEARRMLETGEYPSVKAVCLSVGLKDIRNFSRKFKERFGIYPSECLSRPM